MYEEETGCFDPNSIAETAIDGFEESMKLPTEQVSYNQNPDVAVAAMELELQNQLSFNVDNTHLIHDPTYDHSNWETNTGDFGGEQQSSINMNSQNTPDLLNLLHFPNSSISFSTDSVLYDPLFHLNLPPQPPLFKELFQSIPQGYSLPTPRVLFGDERDLNGIADPDGDGGQYENRVLEFTREVACIGRGRAPGGGGKIKKHFATERQRREQLNDKYKALRSLVPTPSKTDRASVVGDAIDYIKELLRTVNELKLLVEKKRCGKERCKRRKTEDDDTAAGDDESCNIKSLADPDQSYNGSLRSSWLQRKSKDTEVDVRIIDDEVTIKLIQRKKIDCLLPVSKVLDDLQLDLHHVAGGHIGDYYSFLFNTKICEGSSVYAGAIANKLIDVMDRQYAAIPSNNSY